MTRHPGIGRYRWVVLAAATFTQAASGFFVQGIGAMGVHLRHDLDLSAAQLGLLLSAAQLAPLAGLLVAGELLDRHDERWVVGAGAGVVAVSLAVGSLAPGYAALLLVLLVVGAGYSTVQPGAASRWRPGSTRPGGASPWASGRPVCRWAAYSPRLCCPRWPPPQGGARRWWRARWWHSWERSPSRPSAGAHPSP
ncbi:MFS transporter [Nonomuraea wenchangensis]|uniref:MFS transporter n=1 Tax=Nonomuraea wenchangensis TaxID=568860 RepID=UPI00384B5B48